MSTRRSLTVTPPRRDTGSGFAAIRRFNVALPWPVPGDARAIQPASAVAVHAHSSCVAILTLPVPPPASIADVAVDSDTWHLAGAGPVEVVSDDVQALKMLANAIAITTRREVAASPVRGRVCTHRRLMQNGAHVPAGCFVDRARELSVQAADLSHHGG